MRPRIAVCLLLLMLSIACQAPFPPLNSNSRPFNVQAVSVNKTLLPPFLFVRETGKPATETRTFNVSAQDLAGTFKLAITNGPSPYERVSSATIKLNGQVVAGPEAFNQQVANLDLPLSALQAGSNILEVTLASKPNSALRIGIAGTVPGPDPQPSGSVVPGVLAGLIAWWSGDGHPFDLVGEHHGTLLNGTTFAIGKADQALKLDGVDDYVNVVSTFNFPSYSSPFTLDAWINTTSTAYSFILAYGSNTVPNSMVSLGIAEGGALKSTTGTDTVTGGNVADGQWHHVAVSFDGRNFNLYLDGQLIASKAMAVQGALIDYAYIGRGYEGQYFNGLIDELELYDRLLSQVEIQDLFEAGDSRVKPPTPSPQPTPTAFPSIMPTPIASETPQPSPTSPSAPAQILVYVINHPGVWDKTHYNKDLPEILNQVGFDVSVTDKNSSGIVTETLLQGYDQLWILPIHDTGLTMQASERDVIHRFRDSGKGVIVITDHFNLQDANLISNAWGITFHYAAHRNPGFPIVKVSPPHAILADINTLSAYNSGAAFTFSGNARCIGIAASTNQCFVGILDEAGKGRVVVEGGFARFTDVDGTSISDAREGTCPTCLIRYGDGPQYVQNIARWLQRQLPDLPPEPPGLTPCIADMVTWWPMNENNGQLVHDVINHQYGIAVGSGWVNGRVGAALRFDGINDYIAVAHSPVLSIPNGTPFSIEAWINPDLSGQFYQQIVDKGNPYSGPGFAFGLEGDHLIFQYGRPGLHTQGSFRFQSNQWYHVAVTYDGSVARIYVNGQLDAASGIGEILTDTNGSLVNNGTLNIGRRSDPFMNYISLYYKKDIDEVSLYKRALTPEEIQTIFNFGSQGKCGQGPLPMPTSVPLPIPTPTGTSMPQPIPTPTPTPHPPAIHFMNANPNPIACAGCDAALAVSASDLDTPLSSLTFSWKVIDPATGQEAGQLYNTHFRGTTYFSFWTSPRTTQSKTYQATVTISDGFHTNTSSPMNITVKGGDGLVDVQGGYLVP